VLAAAPPSERAELVSFMCIRGAQPATVLPHLEPLLTSSDPNVTCFLGGLALWLRSPKAQAFLRAVLPRVLDPELRADLVEALGDKLPSFWAER